MHVSPEGEAGPVRPASVPVARPGVAGERSGATRWLVREYATFGRGSAYLSKVDTDSLVGGASRTGGQGVNSRIPVYSFGRRHLFTQLTGTNSGPGPVVRRSHAVVSARPHRAAVPAAGRAVVVPRPVLRPGRANLAHRQVYGDHGTAMSDLRTVWADAPPFVDPASLVGTVRDRSVPAPDLDPGGLIR